MIARAFLALSLLAFVRDATAELTQGGPLPVRILYDNSGSMYPGYAPPGAPDRRSRAELGARYFHQSPAFAQWLEEFVQRQTIVDASTIGMWTFTSNGAFTPNDLQQVHPDVPVSEFNVAAALSHFPPYQGDRTYLTESLTAFSRDFTGLVWIITDNIVETEAGQPDAGVKQFFETLDGRPEFRSVHLFKYAFEDGGQTGTLAVYGVLVSASTVPNGTLGYYDRRFDTLRTAKRRDGTNLFPSQEHLKLKDLTIEPTRLSVKLNLDPPDSDKEAFKEGQSIELALDGEIRSLLTHHTITAGRYELVADGPFVPEDWAREKLGAQSLAPDAFASITGTIDNEIPPSGTHKVNARLKSAQPVSFDPSNLIEWVRLAWNGATVRYTGRVRMSFQDVQVRLERQEMAGIYGIDQASSVFDFQERSTLQVQPSSAPASFALTTKNNRTYLLLLALAVIAVIVALAVFAATRERSFQIGITGRKPATVGLRRLGAHNVMLDAKSLGRLSRGFWGGYRFDPQSDTTTSIVPAGDGTWAVHIIGGSTHQLTIKAEGGGTAKQPTTPSGGAPHAQGPPPAPSARKSAPPPPRPPSIKR